MVTIDKRFNANELDIIKEMSGKVFEGYECDPFIFTTSVYGIIGLHVGGKAYTITNFVQVENYYGRDEDVANFRVDIAKPGAIHSYMDGGKLINTPVDSTISRVRVINEHQKLFYRGEQTYDVQVTRGIIFELSDGRQISFEKDVWFSEEITIERGDDVISKFTPCEEFIHNWDGADDYRAECSREEIVF